MSIAQSWPQEESVMNLRDYIRKYSVNISGAKENLLWITLVVFVSMRDLDK